MLKIQNLSKVFDQLGEDITVIKSLNLEVKKGQVFGFLGPNGAGKTTTVKMMVGLLRPTTGKIIIGNHPAGTLEANRILGFMSENPQFYQYLTAREVLTFVGDLFGIERQELARRTDRLLNQVGLKGKADIRARNFSKGMHQRLAFAVAMINMPELLILDEPLDGLDPIGRQDFKQLIRQWKKDGRTVFFSSHILADVEELCDRVAILDKGKIVKIGSPKELIGQKRQTLEEVFVETVRTHVYDTVKGDA